MNTGKIYWFLPKLNLVTYGDECQILFESIIDAKFNKEMDNILIDFKWEGESCGVSYRKKDNDNYSGIVTTSSDLNYGKSHVKLFKNDKSIILMGDWDDKSASYSCLIEIFY
jgi:hypothetical protein